MLCVVKFLIVVMVALFAYKFSCFTERFGIIMIAGYTFWIQKSEQNTFLAFNG